MLKKAVAGSNPSLIVRNSWHDSTPSKGVFDILLSKDVGPSQIDDSALQCDRDGVGPVIGSQFGENVLDMAFDGYLGQR